MKKILVLFLAMLLLVFTACSASPNLGVDGSDLAPFIIGGIGPLSEDRSHYGKSVMQGAQIAVNEINATGGVNGFRLVLNFQDSKGNGKTAVATYDKLMDNDMRVLLGGVFTDETEALLPSLERDGILAITPTATGNDLVNAKNLFRLGYSNGRVGSIIADFIADRLLGQTVLLVYSDDVFGGSEVQESLVSVGKGRELKVHSVQIPTEGVPDFTEAMDLLETESPQVLVLALSPSRAAEFLHQAEWSEESGIKVFCTAAPNGEFRPRTGLSDYDGICLITAFSSADEVVVTKSFVQNYKDAYEELPDCYAADAYDAVYAIAEAIRRAGITPKNVENDDFHQKMISAMTKIEVHGVTGTLSWTTDGESTRAAAVKILRDGVYLPYQAQE